MAVIVISIETGGVVALTLISVETGRHGCENHQC